MKAYRKFGHQASGLEYCRGYVDEHGQWNNGFYCPQWGGPDRKYCCGTESHRFCCPQEPPPEGNGLSYHRLPVMLGLVLGSLVVAMVTVAITCYFCRCCWLYRRRKRIRHEGPPHVTGGPVDYAVNYTVCPHATYLRDGATSCYPLDDPPPYPGEPSSGAEEKQPLNPTQLCVAIDGPDDITSPMTFALSRPSSSSCSSSSPGGAAQPSPASPPGDARHHRRLPLRSRYHDVTIYSNLGAIQASDPDLAVGDGNQGGGCHGERGNQGRIGGFHEHGSQGYTATNQGCNASGNFNQGYHNNPRCLRGNHVGNQGCPAVNQVCHTSRAILPRSMTPRFLRDERRWNIPAPCPGLSKPAQNSEDLSPSSSSLQEQGQELHRLLLTTRDGADAALGMASSSSHGLVHTETYLSGHFDLTDFAAALTIRQVGSFSPLEERRGDIKLTTFRSPPSPPAPAPVKSPQHAADVIRVENIARGNSKRTLNPARRSIELGSFFRNPLGSPPGASDKSLLKYPRGGASDAALDKAALLSVQNGEVFGEPGVPGSPAEPDEDDLSDLNVKVIPQG